jgi:hypothetical protein
MIIEMQETSYHTTEYFFEFGLTCVRNKSNKIQAPKKEAEKEHEELDLLPTSNQSSFGWMIWQP